MNRDRLRVLWGREVAAHRQLVADVGRLVLRADRARRAAAVSWSWRDGIAYAYHVERSWCSDEPGEIRWFMRTVHDYSRNGDTTL